MIPRLRPRLRPRGPLILRMHSTSTAVHRIPHTDLPPTPPTSTSTSTSPNATTTTPPATPRLAALRQTLATTPNPLTDTFARTHTYLRLSLTERCNLRCTYCMPASGVPLSPPPSLLSTPELLELSSLFVAAGVTKIRLTGGEPTVRRDVIPLIASLGAMRPQGLAEIGMTSNGVLLGAGGGRRLRAATEAGLTGLNLSLDTMVPAKFEFVTRRQGLGNVLACIEAALGMGFGLGDAGEGGVGGAGKGHVGRAGKKLKVNVVVMAGVNDDEILDFVEFTRARPLEVRFIEYMPFDGNAWASKKMFPYAAMLDTIKARYPDFAPTATQLPHDTAKTWQVPGYAGRVGFITSMTENFCGTCNRLRITGDGSIKVCLFGNEEVSLRDLMREYRGRDEEVGAGSEERRAEMAQRLMEVVGAAVGRKREGHKPAEELRRDTGRPMILIGG
ncbi:hypothetical protein EDC01DRAFT_653412 [Geopyxis carbonaria]|nr:hypothetical protein EDC01DRAFT_653412 [Geopyxis carbonaria]